MGAIEIFIIFSMMSVMWFDATRYIIPNWLVGALLVLYPVAVYMAPVEVDWKMAVLGMLIVFAAGYLLFMFKMMGAGDIKLIMVCALWAGFSHLPDFLFLVGVIGGGMALAVWGLRKIIVFAPFKTIPRILREKQPIPYGIAIAGGFLMMLYLNEVPVFS